jgi:glycosyltransferase involved in cell wall biosynthesis
MKPYLLVTGDFVKTGGMDQANYALAKYLAHNGYETHLAAYRIDEELGGYPNVHFHRVPKPANSYFLGGPLLARAGWDWASRIAARGGRVVVNGGNCMWPDVNWIHHLHQSYKPRIEAGVLRRVKGEINFRLAASSERRILPIAQVRIAQSRRTRSEVVQTLGIPERAIHVVYLGVDPSRFLIRNPPERAAAKADLGCDRNKLAVAFVGALGDRRKGFDVTFAAWRVLCGDPAWDAELIVVGAGAELPMWRFRAREEGLDSRIRFLGFDPDPEFVARVFCGCDALVAPTRYEGYGLAIQEAVCCGLPAIVSRAAPVTERFGGALEELMLADPEDIDDVVHRLRLWRSRREHFAAAATVVSQNLRRHSWENMASEFVDTVENLEGKPPSGSAASLRKTLHR